MSKSILKKIAIAISIIVGLIFAKCLATICLNEIMINNMNGGDYSDGAVSILYALNLNEPYIVYYNDGIRLYKSGDYESSEEKFAESIKHNPPEARRCDIRINISLAMLGQITKTDSDVRKKLNDAKNVLYEDGCANKADDNGKSRDAEKLEKEIDELLASLGDEPPSDPDGPSSGGGEDVDPVNIKDIEQQLKQQQKNTYKSRQQDIDTMRELTGDYYSGKTW